MTTEFILPDIGEGIVECELLEWLVAEGDTIEEDQPVAEVMTDKATVQIPAMHAGTITKLHYAVGDIAKVHEPLFVLQRSDDASADAAPAVKEATTEDIEQSNASDKVSATQPNAEIDDFILPDIGEGIVECEIVKWNVAEGDSIEEDQSVVEVMTDKAVVEIPAKNAGVVHKLYYKQGDIAKVHAPLFALALDGVESTQANTKPSLNTHTQQASAAAAKPTPAAATGSSDKWEGGSFEPPIVIPGKVLASPAVRRVARENNVDLTNVSGSGKKGRILKQDVLSMASSKVSAEHSESARVEIPKVDAQPSVSEGAVRTEKVRGIQLAMAKQMSASVYTIPHFTVSDEVRMDNLMALRAKLKPSFEAQGVKLSFMPFFIKAMSLALQQFPAINAQLNDDVTEISYFSDHNIGFAVDSKIGLLVPNIKRVQTLSLFEIAQKMQVIIDQARAGKVSGEDLKGGTISISNIGAIGGITATPVINKPEAAIVALGKTQKLPRFNDDGDVEAQHIMMANWSGDHRLIDGATMVRFNNLWMSYLVEPENMLMHMR
ncbi:dihydrolipoyllysine-residue acetyltransferase [Alteromonas sp. A079]|uniref:dihydrolipoyllysine-residue acetyltransferase n=1 Tax=Alteromonas sp. A079 TaxID=3410268 RepID=UPI003B9FA5D7